jgi:hypothetical protein
VSPELVKTEPPTDREIDFVRHFAPAASMGRGLATELTINNLFKRVQQRGKM